MNEFNKCLICSHSAFRRLPRYSKDFLVKCRNCGFVFSQRIPTQAELVEEYSSTYSRNDAISPITLKRYDEIFLFLEQFRRNNNIIDVGAGNGHFIQAAKLRGWNAFGTEFDERAVAICASKGVTMHHGKLDPSNYQPGQFDVITSFEVIEHINNPIEEVQNFFHLLRSGGLVYLTTPNYNSLSHLLLREKWTVFNYPEHLSYYTPRTLSRLFGENGFSVRDLRTTGIGITRLKASAGIGTGSMKNVSTESVRKLTEGKGFGALAKSTVNFVLNALKKGDKIKAQFIRQ